MLADREEAGRQLAAKLSNYRGTDAVILALPRGGVVVGYEIARELSLPLDIVPVRKLGHPRAPEFALGAVDEHGTQILNETEAMEVDPEWLKQETAREMEEAKRRSSVYRGGKKALPLTGKRAIIVDDGVATGYTMRLAIKAVKAQRPARIIAAAPVSSVEASENISNEADEFITLEPPEEFLGAVGAHYVRFEQVGDAEVIRLLKQ
jgi:predicted phosphoribosyltransferase